MTEYWNEFRLASSEAELDDATEGEWLLMGMSPTLQNAWGGESDPYESVDTLARWAIEKETKLTMIQTFKKDGKQTIKPHPPLEIQIERTDLLKQPNKGVTRWN